jgi:hypothetical protein
MQEHTRLKRLIAASGLSLIVTLTASAQSATTTITERPGSYSRDTTVTRANGQTATYRNNAAWGNGSYTDNRTVTGFNGKTATYQDNRSWGNGSYTNTRSYTGRNGGTRTDTVTRSGGVVTNTFTGENGNSRTVSHPAGYRRYRR